MSAQRPVKLQRLRLDRIREGEEPNRFSTYEKGIKRNRKKKKEKSLHTNPIFCETCAKRRERRREQLLYTTKRPVGIGARTVYVRAGSWALNLFLDCVVSMALYRHAHSEQDLYIFLSIFFYSSSSIRLVVGRTRSCVTFQRTKGRGQKI